MSNHSCAVLEASRAVSIGRSSSRCALRSALDAKRVSAASCGNPTASQNGDFEKTVRAIYDAFVDDQG